MSVSTSTILSVCLFPCYTARITELSPLYMAFCLLSVYGVLDFPCLSEGSPPCIEAVLELLPVDKPYQTLLPVDKAG